MSLHFTKLLEKEGDKQQQISWRQLLPKAKFLHLCVCSGHSLWSMYLCPQDSLQRWSCCLLKHPQPQPATCAFFFSASCCLFFQPPHLLPAEQNTSCLFLTAFNSMWALADLWSSSVYITNHIITMIPSNMCSTLRQPENHKPSFPHIL